MQRDKVLGLSLAILLIGFAGAFCFRNETGSMFNGPQLQNPSALDKAISDKEGPKPYTGNLGEKKPEATPTGVTLEGIEADMPFASSTPDEPVIEPFRNESAPKQNGWDTPDYSRKVQSPSTRQGVRPQMSNSTPVSVQKNATKPATNVWIPKHNQAWEVEPANNDMNAEAETPSGYSMRTHRVQPGDTLTGIAAHYLGSSNRYVEIFEANRDTLETPNDLRAGMNLRIPIQARSAKNSPANSPEAYNYDRRGTAPRDTRMNGASNSRRIESTPTGFQAQRTKPGTDSMGLPAKKFVPVSRSPLAPRAIQGDPTPSKPRPLSQVPPGDLPEMSMQYYPKGENETFAPNDVMPPIDALAQEMQIVPMKKPIAEQVVTGRLHKVKRGETLESIALKTYGSRAKSLMIYEANRDRLKNPNGIREGITILLP